MAKNERGLTLLELLAVLVIIGIIAAIAIPAIGVLLTNSKEKSDRATEIILVDAAKRYLFEYELNQSKIASTTVIVPVTDLISLGFVQPPLNSVQDPALHYGALCMIKISSQWTKNSLSCPSGTIASNGSIPSSSQIPNNGRWGNMELGIPDNFYVY